MCLASHAKKGAGYFSRSEITLWIWPFSQNQKELQILLMLKAALHAVRRIVPTWEPSKCKKKVLFVLVASPAHVHARDMGSRTSSGPHAKTVKKYTIVCLSHWLQDSSCVTQLRRSNQKNVPLSSVSCVIPSTLWSQIISGWEILFDCYHEDNTTVVSKNKC